MDPQPRVIFRVEPETPLLQQALRDINYGTAMQEQDVATIMAALQNILDLFMSALKSAAADDLPFVSCFKNSANWRAVIAILRRCEHIIKSCLDHDGMQHVQQSLGTLRLIKGGRPQVGKKGCGILGAQAERTIWLYESWWKRPSLRGASGIKPAKGQNARVLDGLADAFMQTREGTLLHEIVHLASMGQMKYLLSLAYPKSRLPVALWNGRDWVDDAVVYEHANTNIFCESIINAKYCRPKKGGGLEWEAAYHLSGVRDLASLRNGDVASVLNADSYNAFAALALMKRVEATFENHQIPSRVHVDIPKLHPNAIGRLRQAFLKSGDGAIRDSQDGQAAENRRRSSEYDHLESIAARDRNGRFCDLIHWPTPADAA